MSITITIDWPAGSGKGTTAKQLAERLSYKYLDSGSMYRALGIYLSENGADIGHIMAELLEPIEISFNNENHVCINGLDYEWKIRNSLASDLASQLSSQPVVRDFLIPQGQRIIQDDNYILEWRDTGTVWVPNAPIKIYLTADPKARAHRRWMDLQKKWEMISEDAVLEQILERDSRDTTRADGPLRKPEGAYEIDTTHMTIPEQINAIYKIVQEKSKIMK